MEKRRARTVLHQQYFSKANHFYSSLISVFITTFSKSV